MPDAVSYQVETWAAFKPDAEPLWSLHWAELGQDTKRMKLDVNVDVYDFLSRNGHLHVVTARAGAELVGYHVSLIEPMLHYKSVLCATGDFYWLKPRFRQGFVGIHLFREVERSLRLRGVQLLQDCTKLAADKGRLFEYLGYTPMDRRYRKWIG